MNKSQRSTNGFICLAFGALLGFIGCVFAILNPYPEYFHAILYVSTILAGLIIFAGLYLVLE